MCGAPFAAQRRWNSLGVSPTSSAEPALNEPRLAEANGVADLGDGEVGGAQQVLRAFHPPPGQVRRGRDPVRGGEEALEVVLADARHRGEQLEVQRLGVVPVGVVAGTAQVHQQVAGVARLCHRMTAHTDVLAFGAGPYGRWLASTASRSTRSFIGCPE